MEFASRSHRWQEVLPREPLARKAKAMSIYKNFWKGVVDRDLGCCARYGCVVCPRGRRWWRSWRRRRRISWRRRGRISWGRRGLGRRRISWRRLEAGWSGGGMRAGSFGSVAPSRAWSGGEFAHAGNGLAYSANRFNNGWNGGRLWQRIRQLLRPRRLRRLRRLGMGWLLALVWRMGFGLGLGIPVRLRLRLLLPGCRRLLLFLRANRLCR